VGIRFGCRIDSRIYGISHSKAKVKVHLYTALPHVLGKCFYISRLITPYFRSSSIFLQALPSSRIKIAHAIAGGVVKLHRYKEADVSGFFCAKERSKDNSEANLTFIAPYIVIYFYSKTNQMHQCPKFILFWNNSTCFERSFRPSSVVHDCTTGICQTDSADCLQQAVAVAVWHMPVAVCTVVNYWWWTERPFETCRVIPK